MPGAATCNSSNHARRLFPIQPSDAEISWPTLIAIGQQFKVKHYLIFIFIAGK